MKENLKKGPLYNPYHLQKQRENLEANSRRQPMSRADFISQAQMLKQDISKQRLKTKD